MQIQQTLLLLTAAFVAAQNNLVNLLACTIDVCSLSQSEWQRQDIDSFLASTIVNLGARANFPLNVAVANTPVDGALASFADCGSLTGECDNSQVVAASTTQTCPSLANSADDRCQRYTDPRAAYVIQNYIELRAGVKAQADDAVRARDNLVRSRFLDELMDNGMGQELGDLGKLLIEFVVSLPFQILTSPFFAVSNGLRAFVQLNRIVDLLPVATPFSFIQLAVQNDQIEDETERVKDQMARQMDLIVDGEIGRANSILTAVFVAEEDANIGDENAARNSMAFQFAQSGAYLNGRPSDDELTNAMETMIKNIIVTSVMNVMGWQVVELPPLSELQNQQTTCRAGDKGLPDFPGRTCVGFRRGSTEQDPRMRNPDVIERLVDWPAMARNALDCGGGQLNAADVDDGQGGLPRCFYNFRLNDR